MAASLRQEKVSLLHRKESKLYLYLALALLSELGYLAIGSRGDLRPHISFYLSCYAALFLLYVISIRIFFLRSQDEQQSHLAKRDSTSTVMTWLIEFFQRTRIAHDVSSQDLLPIGIIFAILFRLTLLFTTPSLSDDIYRYVWDGRVADSGINPYLYAPEAEQLSHLRDSRIYPNINHKEIPTVYPPVSQLVYRGIAALGGGVSEFKAAFVILDLLNILLLVLITQALRINMMRVLIYAWNPLIIVEFAHSGHADVIGVFLMLLALWLMVEGRLVWGNIALALSFLTKFVSGLFLPIFMTWRRDNKMMAPLWFLIVVALLYLPYAEIGSRLFTGLAVYSDKWAFNNSAFGLINSGFRAVLDADWLHRLGKQPDSPFGSMLRWMISDNEASLKLSKGVVVTSFLTAFLYYLMRLRRDFMAQGQQWFFRLGLILFGLFVILNPTVHPWYLTWIVPFLVVHPNRAWLLLTGLVGLSYWVLNEYWMTGIWQEQQWVKYAEYLPFYTFLGYDAVKEWLSRN